MDRTNNENMLNDNTICEKVKNKKCADKFN